VVHHCHNLTDILFPIGIGAEKLCDIDPERDRISKVKRGIRAMLQPYYETLQEKKESAQLTLFLDVF
jgi:hypothetical protein